MKQHHVDSILILVGLAFVVATVLVYDNWVPSIKRPLTLNVEQASGVLKVSQYDSVEVAKDQYLCFDSGSTTNVRVHHKLTPKAAPTYVVLCSSIWFNKFISSAYFTVANVDGPL